MLVEKCLIVVIPLIFQRSLISQIVNIHMFFEIILSVPFIISVSILLFIFSLLASLLSCITIITTLSHYDVTTKQIYCSNAKNHSRTRGYRKFKLIKKIV